MNLLRLPANGWIQIFLVSQPETGMGYQQADIHLKDGCVVANITILNSEIIILPDSYKSVTEQDIARIAVLNGTTCDNPKP